MTLIKLPIDRENPPQSSGLRRNTAGAMVSSQDTRGAMLGSNGDEGSEWLPGRDPDAVPSAKRTAVADTIIAQVNAGGQAYLDESDSAWYRSEFLDDRIDDEQAVYRCLKRASDPATPTVPRFRWVRHLVE